jgi:hypothetical protein
MPGPSLSEANPMEFRRRNALPGIRMRKSVSVELSALRHELWDMKEYARKLGISFRFDPLINARLDGSLEPIKVRLTPKEIITLDKADEGRVTAISEFCEQCWGTMGSDRLYVCGAGVNSFHISATGMLGVCATSREPNYYGEHQIVYIAA